MHYLMSILVVFSNTRGTSFSIRKVSSCFVESSYKELSDKATIVLPRNVPLFTDSALRTLIQVGDQVEIFMGYNGNTNSVFDGYITEINAGIPTEIKCEDAMWKLKQTPVNKSYRSTTLQALLEDIQSDYSVDAKAITLGQLRFAQTTVGKVLEWIKQQYGLNSFFRDGKLVCGNIYQEDSEAKSFVIEHNIKDNGQGLSYKSTTDTRVKVTLESINTDGTNTKVSVGDSGGDEINIKTVGITDTTELTALANEKLALYKRGGYTGNFKTFGTPLVKHGEKCSLKSELFPERDGEYYVSGVKYTFDTTPMFEQEITLSESV